MERREEEEEEVEVELGWSWSSAVKGRTDEAGLASRWFSGLGRGKLVGQLARTGMDSLLGSEQHPCPAVAADDFPHGLPRR